MTSIRITHGIAAAGLALGLVAAHATSGYTVTKQQEGLVSVGMSQSDVMAAIGTPDSNVQYGNEQGRTFTYRLTGDPETLFDIDFDADGKVLSTSEREWLDN
jgi:outer membrane protein assembly factor BamE (lipoprotein component of BamABCDE complex)